MSKLLDLLKKIGKPKCIHKTEPNSIADQQVAVHPLYIFPEVVWLRVADHLSDNADILNFINSSQFFRSLLFHKLVTILFEPVLQIVTTNLVQKVGHNATEIKSSILNCRLVCHSWADSIERLCPHKWNPNCNIQDSSFTVQNECIPKSSIVGQVISQCFVISESNIEKIYKFLSAFVESDFKYPHTILGQGIELYLDDQEDLLVRIDFYQLLGLFLATFGQYVYNCNFILNNCLSKDDTYVDTIAMLKSLPNLQNLVISDLDRSSSNALTNAMGLRRSQLSLKYLKNLELHNVGFSLCNILTSDAMQLNKLCIKKYSETSCKVPGLNIPSRLGNVTQMEIWDISWRAIGTLSLPKSPMKRLHIQLEESSWHRFKWVEFVESLSRNFGKTLEELMIAFPKFLQDNEKLCIMTNREVRLNMPKVKKIYFVLKNECSFDFLLGTTESLEFLQICVDTWDKVQTPESRLKRKKEIVEIWGYHNQMYNSNIWELFPNIQNVELNELEYRNVEFKSWKWARRIINSTKRTKKYDIVQE